MVSPKLDFDAEAATKMQFFERCDHVWDAVVKACWASAPPEEVGAQVEAVLVNRLEEPWRISYAVHEMEYDVLDGGFKSFFWSHGDVLNESVLAGLGLIGASKHQAVFRDAIASQYDEEALSQLSSRYYEACREVGPRELLAKYIVRHFDDFSGKADKASRA